MPSLKTLWVYGKESQLPILRSIGDAKEPVGAVLIEGLNDDIGQVIVKTIRQKFPQCLIECRSQIEGNQKFAAWIHDPSKNTKAINGLYCVKQTVPDAKVLRTMSHAERSDLMSKSMVPRSIGDNDATKAPQAIAYPTNDVPTVIPSQVVPTDDFLDDDDNTVPRPKTSTSSKVMQTSFGLRYSIINDPNLKFNLPRQNIPANDPLNKMSPAVYFQSDDVLAYAETKMFALVNAVNTQGVMGAGMALQFKNAMPKEYFDDYQDYCKWFNSNKRKATGFGFCHLVILNGLYVFGLPTKIGPSDKLNIELYKAGLRSLLHLLMEAEEHTNARPFVLIPKGLGNGLATPVGMTKADCNILLEKATAEVVEQGAGILNVERLLWLDKLGSDLMPFTTPRLRVVNVSLHVKMLRDTFKFNVPDEFTSSWKVGRFDMVNFLGGQYLVVEPNGQAHTMGVNYWNESYGIPEVEPGEMYDLMARQPRFHLPTFELEALQILKWARWLKVNQNQKLTIMTANSGKYRWLIADDGMVSGYGCRSLLDLSISINLINKLWEELRQVKDRIWFTFDTFWTGALVQEALTQSRVTWEENPNLSFQIRSLVMGLCNIYKSDDGSTTIRSNQLAKHNIKPSHDFANDIAYRYQFQDLYYTDPNCWSSGGGWLGKPSWYRCQKDFQEVKGFHNKNLIRKQYTI